MTESQKKAPLQGKKKGGSIFPRIDLEQAVKYSAKLVSKTHTGAQPPNTLFRGVFGAAGSRAAVRSSALKQFGLMDGSDKEGYKATQLAIGIATSPPEERGLLLRESCLKPKVFGMLFETYHGDDVSVAKIRQQAASGKVHPDELDNCAENFVSSAVYAQLARRTGDQVSLVPSSEAGVAPIPSAHAGSDGKREIDDDDTDLPPDASVSPHVPSVDTNDSKADSATRAGASPTPREPNDGFASARAVIHVNVTLDSSLDTDKLEKQLTLLRRFGAL